MTQGWTEAEIAAFIDGALEETDAMRIEEIINRDPEAQAAAEAIMRQNDLLRAAFADIAAAPVPAAITQTVTGDDPKVVPFPSRAGRIRTWASLAAAASIAVTIGFTLGTTQGPSGGLGQISLGDAPAGGALQVALDTVPSGTLHEGRILPMVTFVDNQDRYCREFEVFGDLPEELEIGVACRRAPGTWHVEIIVTAPVLEPNSEGFVPASGPGGDALDAMLDALGAGLPLAPDEEEKLIEAAWQGPGAARP